MFFLILSLLSLHRFYFLHCFERGFLVSCIDFYNFYFIFQFRTVFLLQIEFVYYLFFLVCFLYLLDFSFLDFFLFYKVSWILYVCIFILFSSFYIRYSFSFSSPYPFVQFFNSSFFFFEWLVSPFCSKTKILSVAKKNVKM